MDDRIYLAVYEKCGIKEKTDILSGKESICEVVIPCYEKVSLDEVCGIRRSRFDEVKAEIYVLDNADLESVDEIMKPLVRHQSMAADDDRLYNVYVYVVSE